MIELRSQVRASVFFFTHRRRLYSRLRIPPKGCRMRLPTIVKTAHRLRRRANSSKLITRQLAHKQEPSTAVGETLHHPYRPQSARSVPLINPWRNSAPVMCKHSPLAVRLGSYCKGSFTSADFRYNLPGYALCCVERQENDRRIADPDDVSKI